MSSTVATEAFFSGIKQKLLTEIGLANQSICVAVAWFTDKELLGALLQRQQAGVRVALAIAKDAINESLNFEPLVAAGGNFYRVEGALMHNKFCLLDGRDVITGSYNWTYRAASENYENIIVTTGDYDLAYRYLAEFNRITGHGPGATIDGLDMAKVVRRMQVIRSLVQLDEQEDVVRQVHRLNAEWPDPLAQQIRTHIETGHYANALVLIEEFISVQSQVAIYEDPLIAALKLEIRNLENSIVAVEAETADVEKSLSDYNHEFTTRLGSLAEEILRLKTVYASTHQQESQYSQNEYEEAKRRYEEFKQDRQDEEQKPFHALDAAGREQLKKMHRRCVLLCHPDKVADELKAEATELFRQVQDCYERQDLTQLAALATQLAQGILRPNNIATAGLDYLKLRRQRLEQQLAALLQRLESLRSSPMYQQLVNITDVEHHFRELHEQLSQELIRWQSHVPESATA